jgi:hypothetical protein
VNQSAKSLRKEEEEISTHLINEMEEYFEYEEIEDLERVRFTNKKNEKVMLHYGRKKSNWIEIEEESIKS